MSVHNKSSRPGGLEDFNFLASQQKVKKNLPLRFQRLCGENINFSDFQVTQIG
jgi:hypothetical protein